jgi:Ring finger domain
LNPDSLVAHRIRNYTASHKRVPLGLVASAEGQGQGPCTLEHKVYTAASIGVSFLVMVTSSHMFPMQLRVASDPSILANLTLLSVTSECKDRILRAAEFTSMGDDALLGWRKNVLGPHADVRVTIDSTVPARQDFLLIPLALALLLTVWISSLLFLSPDPVSSPDLLTEEFVYGLCCSPQVAHELISNCEDDEPPSCPICLDPFQVDSTVTILPCGHPYHQHCVLPWLTQRQSVCPLCKFDMKLPTTSPHHHTLQVDPGSSLATLPSPERVHASPGSFLRDIRDRFGVAFPVQEEGVTTEAAQLQELELSQSDRVTST